MNQVRPFAQQSFSLANRLANQFQFAVLEVTESTVDDASGAAGDARRKIVLFDQQSAFAGHGALPRDCHAVDAATNDHHVEVLVFQRGSRFHG